MRSNKGEKQTKRTVIAILAIIAILSGCVTTQEKRQVTLAKPKLFLNLPEFVNGPDAMTMAPNGNIMINCLCTGITGRRELQ